ncbi:hypothetical protein EDD21DRAFT_387323 [Dissophora ornata]|nr:hypothetical protein EDD21DRAFT_387323 [Dissophora ornata]
MTSKSSSDSDTVILYNDRICGAVNYEAASQTGLIFVAQYFSTVPQSLRWTRFQVVSSVTTTATTTTTTTSQSTLSSSSTTSLVPTSTSTLTLSASTLTTTATATSSTGPTPIHTNLPTALIPPQPINSNSTDGCGDLDGDSCKSTGKVNQILIISVVVAVVVVMFMGAGAFYIFRNFHTSDSMAGSSTNRSNSARGGGTGGTGGGGGTGALGSSHDVGSGTALTDFNEDYHYVHEEDENAAPKFMFNHRHDNIDTNKNPKLFQESAGSPSSSRTRYSDPPTQLLGSFRHNPSDINLIERTK